MNARALERLVGAVIVPELRVGGPRPSADYLRRFPPAVVIAFGRSRATRATLRGLERELEQLRADCAARGERVPLVCCDLEEGAGLHFEAPGAPRSATRLPPALALAAAEAGAQAQDAAQGAAGWIARAAELTAREARALGVGLVLAPVLDVNTRADNPIIATRSLGDEPRAVARRAAEFLAGLRAGGALACLKHFPGHGDTDRDSHSELPTVAKSRAELEACELLPYRELFARHAPAAVMVAHLDVPALSGAPGLPSTLAPRVIRELLRGELGFRGAVLTDGLDMGALRGLERLHARALAAGCDGLLGPPQAERAAEELLGALADGSLALERLCAAAEKMEALPAAASALARARAAERGTTGGAGNGAEGAAEFAAELARASLVLGPLGWPLPERAPCALEVVPDAAGSELEPLRARVSSAVGGAGGARELVLAVPCTVGAGRGRAGLAPAEERALAERVEAELARRGRCGLLWFGSPQVLPAGLWRRPGVGVLIAWSPSAPLQSAVASFLGAARRAPGRLPVREPVA